MIGTSEKRLDQARQEPEALGENRPVSATKQVLDDQAEPFAAEPAERLEHDVRPPVQPSLVHVHGDEGAEARAFPGA